MDDTAQLQEIKEIHLKLLIAEEKYLEHRNAARALMPTIDALRADITARLNMDFETKFVKENVDAEIKLVKVEE